MYKINWSKLRIGLLLVGSTFIYSACNKGNTNSSEKTVELYHNNVNFEIPIQITTGDNDSIGSFYYKMNMDSFVKSYGKYDTGDIRSVKLKYCRILLSNGDTIDNFKNFHTANIGVTSGSNPNIYRISLFTDIVDTNAYTLELHKNFDPNLASYFRDDSVRYRLYGNFRRPTTKTLNATASLGFDLTLIK